MANMAFGILLLFIAWVDGAALHFGGMNGLYSRRGSPIDTVTAPQGGVALMGGGEDCDDAFKWMCQRSGGGDFLVIRATGTDAYNPYIEELCGSTIASVATLIIKNRNQAQDRRVQQIILEAEAIFIAGGDQSDYTNFWTGTLVQDAVNQRVVDGAPLGGTSAGMAVIPQFIYNGDGVTSAEALANPFDNLVQFGREFILPSTLPHLTGLLTDMHFVTRDRMGRDLAFMCRLHGNGWVSHPRVISANETTALLLIGSQGTVVGTGSVYFISAHRGPPAGGCEPNTPLTYPAIQVYRIEAGGTFDISQWLGRGGLAYTVAANDGVMESSQAGGSLY